MPMTQKQPRFKPIHVILMALVPAIAVGGFLIMYSLAHLGLNGGGVNGGLFMFILIVFGLAVPYAMLKLGVHETAYIRGEEERELELKDIPKDKEQLWDNEKWNREQLDVKER